MKEKDLNSLKVTRGDATMLYATARGSYTVRLHLGLDQNVDPEAMRRALDQTAERYPYFCVTLKKNEKEFYYERNESPVALLNTDKMITLGTQETNGHIWAVCYKDDHLYLDFFHGRADGAGMYKILATLLYYYFHEVYGLTDDSGIRTLDTPFSEAETADPMNSLPLIDLKSLKLPPAEEPLSMMNSLGLQRGAGKGYIRKISIPEEVMIPFIKENDATPGILICILMARAIERVVPEHTLPIINSYIINARPMLNGLESFHNCTARAVFKFDEAIRKMPLDMQCTAYRGKTILQSDETAVRRMMTFSASTAQMVLDLPDFDTKAKVAGGSMARVFTGSSYIVSYVGRWPYPQLGEHIREFWTETPAGQFTLIELSAVNGNVFVSMVEPYDDDIYYKALAEELKENGIAFKEFGKDPISVAEIRF